jgi:hypothetical protein
MCGKWEVDLRSNLFDPISNQLPFSDFVGDKGFVVVVCFFLTFRVRQAFKWNTLAKKKKKISSFILKKTKYLTISRAFQTPSMMSPQPTPIRQISLPPVQKKNNTKKASSKIQC